MLLWPDLAKAGIEIATTLIKLHRLDKWLRLTFSLALSFWLSGSSVTGTMLAAHRPLNESVGAGLIAGSFACYLTFNRSDLTKGMTLTVAKEGMHAEGEGFQVVEKK